MTQDTDHKKEVLDLAIRIVRMLANNYWIPMQDLGLAAMVLNPYKNDSIKKEYEELKIMQFLGKSGSIYSVRTEIMCAPVHFPIEEACDAIIDQLAVYPFYDKKGDGEIGWGTNILINSNGNKHTVTMMSADILTVDFNGIEHSLTKELEAIGGIVRKEKLEPPQPESILVAVMRFLVVDCPDRLLALGLRMTTGVLSMLHFGQDRHGGREL